MNPDPVSGDEALPRTEAGATPEEGAPEQRSLSGVIRRTAMASAVAVAFAQAVSLAQTLVLARVLSPVEVGIFYSGTVLIMFLAEVAEGGLKQALIQRRGNVEQAANTVFWATLAVSIGWVAVALASAPVLSHIFHDSRVGQVAAITAATVVLHALTNVPDALLQRKLDFRQKLFVRPGTALVFAVASVLLALYGLGVWSLVIAYYLSVVTWVCISWTLAGWRPRRGQASFTVWRELANFGWPIVIRGVLYRVKDLVEAVIVGNAMSTSGIGNYRYGSRLGMLPGMVIIEVGSYVLFPAFSRTATEPDRFRSSILRALRAIWLVATPAAGLMAVCGLPAVILLLGPPWRDAGLMFTSMTGVGLGVAMSAVGLESIKGAGRPSLLNWVTGVDMVLGVGLFLVLTPFGPTGVGAALSITFLVGGVLSLWLARGVAGIPYRAIAGILIGPLIAAAAAAAPWYWLEVGVTQAETRGHLLGLTLLGGEVLGYLVTYLLLLAVLVPWARTMILAAFRLVLQRIRRTPATT